MEPGKNDIYCTYKKSYKKVIKDISSKDFNEGLNEEQIDIIFSSCQNLSILSTREKEILRHILLGEKRKEIGVSLFISESAVKKHTTNIFRKLNVNNRNELFTEVKKSLKSSFINVNCGERVSVYL